LILEILKSIIFGIIQGITEWLPISSTGHMILADEFIRLDVSEAFKNMFLVVIQLGSILAVLVLYFNKLNPFLKQKQEKSRVFSLWYKIIIGTIPAIIIGKLFKGAIHEHFYNPLTIAIALIFYGIAFILIENRNNESAIKSLENLDFRTAFLIGTAQVLAFIPGTSRSGATILAAVFLGASRNISAEFSFFLAIPAMFGASTLEILDYSKDYGLSFSSNEWAILIFGMLVAFVVSLIVIKFLLEYIRRNSFKVFGYYRIVLGVIILAYFLITKHSI
jgi:undecaprenyl-diphosphatase